MQWKRLMYLQTTGWDLSAKEQTDFQNTPKSIEHCCRDADKQQIVWHHWPGIAGQKSTTWQLLIWLCSHDSYSASSALLSVLVPGSWRFPTIIYYTIIQWTAQDPQVTSPANLMNVASMEYVEWTRHDAMSINSIALYTIRKVCRDAHNRDCVMWDECAGYSGTGNSFPSECVRKRLIKLLN